MVVSNGDDCWKGHQIRAWSSYTSWSSQFCFVLLCSCFVDIQQFFSWNFQMAVTLVNSAELGWMIPKSSVTNKLHRIAQCVVQFIPVIRRELGGVYMILVWVSFQYEFIPVPTCSSVFVYMIPVQNAIPVLWSYLLIKYRWTQGVSQHVFGNNGHFITPFMGPAHAPTVERQWRN